MCHSFRSACQQRVLKSVSWPWLYTLRGLGSLTMAFTGKSISIIYNINIYYVEVCIYIYIYIIYVYMYVRVCVNVGRWMFQAFSVLQAVKIVTQPFLIREIPYILKNPPLSLKVDVVNLLYQHCKPAE